MDECATARPKMNLQKEFCGSATEDSSLRALKAKSVRRIQTAGTPHPHPGPLFTTVRKKKERTLLELNDCGV